MTHPTPLERAIRHPLLEVGLADLIQAMQVLKLDRGRLAVTAELLGLTDVKSTSSPTAFDLPSLQPSTTKLRTLPSSLHGPTETVPTSIPASAPLSDTALRATVTQLPRTVPLQMPFSSRSLAELLPLGTPPPPAQGLFPARSHRALLGALGATLRPEGDVDIEATVTALAKGEPLRKVPRYLVKTTRGGLDLLLDVGAAMDPYRADMDRLPDEFARVVGSDGLQLRWFEDCPLSEEGVLIPERLESEPYRLPQTGTPILAVTMFGVRGPIPPQPEVLHGWRQFVSAANRANTPLVILTPLVPSQRPADLPPYSATVTWDHTASVRNVSHVVRRAARAGWRAAFR
jgi:hypothetical protein